jgi:hypothetical protein
MAKLSFEDPLPGRARPNSWAGHGFHDMEAGVGDRLGWTAEGTGKTGDAVLGMLYGAEAFLAVHLEDLGGADIHAQLASPAGLLMNRYLQ